MSRVEVWSKKNFNRISTPFFQRPVNKKVVREIATYIMGEKNPILGVLDVAEIKSGFGVQYYILDGQHRLEAIKVYAEENRSDILFHVMIYPCNNMADAQHIFQIRNLNVMQNEYIMTGDHRRELLDMIHRTLIDTPLFGNIRNRRPYIFLPDFMDKISLSTWFNDITSLDHFLEKIKDENDKMATWLNNDLIIRKEKITPVMIQKCQESGIFLGLDLSFRWLI